MAPTQGTQIVARRLLNLLTLLSLLLGAMVLVLWVRSYAGLSLAGWETGAVFYTYGSGDGSIVVDRSVHRAGVRSASVPSSVWECLGVSFSRYGTPPQAAEWHLVVPYCVLAAPVAVLPAAWALARLRRARTSPLLCRRCGYDLRATPDKCPECGSPPGVAA